MECLQIDLSQIFVYLQQLDAKCCVRLQKRQAYDLETSFASTSVPIFRKGAGL